jgi:hypothetical protein
MLVFMGLARAQTVDGFTAVFGSARGSALSQAQRDIEEADQCEAAYEKFKSECTRDLIPLSLTDEFVRAHKQGDQAQLESWLVKRMREEKGHTSYLRDLSHLSRIANRICVPYVIMGLKEPALKALTRFFEEEIERTREDSSHINRNILMSRAATAVISGFLFEVDEELLNYLRPLSEVLAHALELVTNCKTKCKNAVLVSTQMATVLETVPVCTVEEGGPLRSWVDALTARHRPGYYSEREMFVLGDLARRQSGAREALAFAPLRRSFGL